MVTKEQVRDRKTSKALMLMLGSNETIIMLALANNVRWYGHALRSEGSYFMMALRFVIRDERKKWVP